jgi:hypothetical protein
VSNISVNIPFLVVCTGQYQTLIKLTTTPVAVCHGSGVSMEDSRANAAHNALQYLRIMFKQ